MHNITLHCRSDSPEWEQCVFAEVLIPETPNVNGDYWTRPAIREAAYAFMREGFGIDVDHDNIDVTGGVYVVETFIARKNDPDFIEGSWVVGMKIEDPELWQRVLNNEINGYSYEALINFLSATLQVQDDGVRTGFTEPDLLDGHTHAYLLRVDETNRPTSGGTDAVQGHYHTITTHTVTDVSAGHSHRYQIVTGRYGR